MNTFRLIIGILGTLLFGFGTIRFWDSYGDFIWLMLAIDAFLVWYVISLWKRR